MVAFLVLLSSLVVTSYTDALPVLLVHTVHVCKSEAIQGHSINLVHYASEPTISGDCNCAIKTGSDVTMETEPGNKCNICVSGTNVPKTCTIHCERSINSEPSAKPVLPNGANIRINVTNINGTIMNLKATKGNLTVHCDRTGIDKTVNVSHSNDDILSDPVTYTASKNDVNIGRKPKCSSEAAVCKSVSKPPGGGRNTELPQKDESVNIDVCSSDTIRGHFVNIVRGFGEPQAKTCTCSLRSTVCLTMTLLSTSTQCGECTSGNEDVGRNCTMRCEKTPSGCTQNVTVTVNAELDKGEMFHITGHKGDNSPEGSAELEVSCNPRSPTNIGEGQPSNFPATTVAAVTSVTILIMLVAILVAVVSYKRRKRMKRNPVYMTLEAGSGRGTVQAASPPQPGDAREQRQNGQTASGSNPSRGHSSHGMASGEHIRSGPTDEIPKQGIVDESMYASAGTPGPDPVVGGGVVYGKPNQDPGEEGVYDHAHGGTTGKVQQVTGVYGRLGQQVDDDVYDHTRRPDATMSVTEGSTYGRLNDVTEDDVYNHTKTTASKVEAYNNEDFSRLKQDDELLGKR